MERVAFLIEETGEHLSCLLNPESVVMTRTAGVEPRRSSGGPLTGTGLADDPLLFTGGGRTELRLDLLFDVDLAPDTVAVEDVRQMTRPIWRLAENSAEAENRRRPPSVRFVWGRAWNVPGVVTEVAERFDRFGIDGSPLRSWMRLVFLRTGQDPDQEGGEGGDLDDLPPVVDLNAPPVGALPVVNSDENSLDETDDAGNGGPSVNPVELGLLSQSAFGTPMLWKQLLQYNGIDDPQQFSGPLAIPPMGGVDR